MAEKLTMPTLTILFQQRAQTAIARSQKGVEIGRASCRERV